MKAPPLLLLLFFFTCRAFAQDTTARGVYYLSLPAAIKMAQEQNKLVQALKQDEKASTYDLQDARNAVLPQAGVEVNYQRFTELTLFDNGWSKSESFRRRPDPNTVNLGANAAFTLFAGGRLRHAVTEESIRRELATLGVTDQAGQSAQLAALLYLDIIRLYKLDSLIVEQVKRAELRLKNIIALYNNQRVTRSDLLRAELNLSSIQLNKETTDNDIVIARQKLAVQLNIPDTAQLVITDTALAQPLSLSGLQASMSDASAEPYILQRTAKAIRLQESRIRSIRSAYYPMIQLYSAYGLNYPNFFFFPPVAQWYAVGFIGIRAQYAISSLYHNKNKVAAARERLNSLQLQRAYISDNVNENIRSLYIKYSESLTRIRVAEKSIEQAAANLKIVSTKYYNQLALLTDLLDADNLYLESNFNLVKAQTDATGYYYRLLYVTGKL
jgi:outer membrane protein